MSSIEQTYNEMKARERKWPGFSNNVPFATIGHWYRLDMEPLTESHELDQWVRKTDVDYQIPTSKMFSPWSSITLDGEHLAWINRQHDVHLQNEHRKNITPEDRTEIDHLISGGTHYGHDSGSSDVTKFLVHQYQNYRDKPDSFIRRPAHPGINAPSMKIDLHKIDGILGQNKFNGDFHSFHGIGFDPDKVAEHSSLLHLPAYTSGSVNRSIALKWAKMSPINGTHHVMHIISPDNSTGLYIGNDPYKDNEVLLPRNITLKLHSNPQDFDVNGNHVKIWTGLRQTHLET